MNKLEINKFDSREELFTAVAERCEKQLQQVISKNNKASFIIPGGTTPAPAFAQLAKSSLNWDKITVAQSDERWVAADHPQSNQGLTATTLLIENAKNTKYIAMKNTHTTVKAGESECDEHYKTLAQPYSLMMLGMGLDGHVASLFPGSKNIDQALDLNNTNQCIAIDATGCEVAGDYPERMSLTLAAILNSRLIILLLTGEEKLKVIDRAQANNNPKILPVSALLNQNKTPVAIYWSK